MYNGVLTDAELDAITAEDIRSMGVEVNWEVAIVDAVYPSDQVHLSPDLNPI
jgi:hypothetical protein